MIPLKSTLLILACFLRSKRFAGDIFLDRTLFFVKKLLTDALRQVRNIIVKPQGNILSNENLPGARAELRNGNVRRASCGPHTSARVPGCFYALGIEGAV
jgi:hypothetical protein